MKQKDNRIAIRVVVFATIILVLLVGVFLVFREGSLPVNAKNTTAKIFTIEQAEPIDRIIRRLESEGFIRNRLVFYVVIKQMGIDTKIQAGKFRLSPSMDAYSLADQLTRGTDDTWVTVIEGLRKEEVAEEMKEKLDIDVAEFISVSEEGYLFPDTYLFPSATTAEDVIAAFNANYKAKVTPDIIASAKELGLTEAELITLASLVEREARSEEARRNVASIMLRRLQEDMPLQIDATVQYALGYDKDEKTYWKRNLTFEDLKFESPYNTYTNTGLPPAPICNPSLSSIIAVSEASPDTPYLFYITGNDNKMHYARDLDGHNENIRRYLSN